MSRKDKGVLIAYTSVYGNTKKASELLAQMLVDVESCNLNRLPRPGNCPRLVKCIPLWPPRTGSNNLQWGCLPIYARVHWITDRTRNYQKRTIGLIENGSWAAAAAKVMRLSLFEKSKEITFTETTVKIMSASTKKSTTQLENLAEELCK